MTTEITETRIRLGLLTGSVGAFVLVAAALWVSLGAQPPNRCRPHENSWAPVDPKTLDAAIVRLQQNTQNIRTNPRPPKAVVRARFDDLASVAPFAPATALEMVLDASKRRAIDAEGCVESHVSLQGTLEAIHVDHPEQGSERTRYFVHTNAQRVEILPARGLREELQPQSTVEVAGFLVGEAVLTDGQAVSEESLVQGEEAIVSLVAPPPAQSAVGSRSVLIVPADFRNTTTTSPTPAELVDIFNQGTAAGGLSVRDYFSKDSYGALNISAQATSPVRIDLDQNCDLFRISDAAVSALYRDNPGISLRSHTNVMLVIPISAPVCGAAYGTIGAITLATPEGPITTGVSWISPFFVAAQANQAPFTMIHELGHNLGTHHANFLDCGLSRSIQKFPLIFCRDIEYGDGGDVMGISGHTSLSRKLSFGWLTAANVPLVTISKTVVISPRATDTTPTSPGTTDVKGIRIQSGEGRIYTVEYRLGRDHVTGRVFDAYDNGLIDDVVLQVSDYFLHPPKTYLIDPYKTDASYAHYLPLNQAFTDEYGVSITLIEKTPTSARIRVKLPLLGIGGGLPRL
jgi:hypothetical protein